MSLTALMYISAAFVCAGFLLGLAIITKRNKGDSAGQTSSRFVNTAPNDGEQNASTWDGRKQRVRIKLAAFSRQLEYLTHALRCKPLLALMGLWIVGNAVFSVE